MKLSEFLKKLTADYTPKQLSELLEGRLSPRQIHFLLETRERVVEEGEDDNGESYQLTFTEPKSGALANLDEICELLLPNISGKEAANNLIGMNERRTPRISCFVITDKDGKEVARYKENESVIAAERLITMGKGYKIEIVTH